MTSPVYLVGIPPTEDGEQSCWLKRSTRTVVMDGGQDRNGLLGDVDTGEDGGSLRDTGEAFVEDLCGKMAELEVDVVLLRTDTTTLSDLKGHGSRHDVTRGKILCSGGVALHETFTLRVQEISSLTTGTCSTLEVVQDKKKEDSADEPSVMRQPAP